MTKRELTGYIGAQERVVARLEQIWLGFVYEASDYHRRGVYSPEEVTALKTLEEAMAYLKTLRVMPTKKKK